MSAINFSQTLPRHTANDAPIELNDSAMLGYLLMAKPRVVIDALKKIGCHRICALPQARRIRREQPIVWARILAEVRAAGLDEE